MFKFLRQFIQSPDGLLHAGATGAIVPDMLLTATPQAGNVNIAVQASVATLANVISNAVTKISGTAAMTGFRLPRGFRGAFIVIPTGISTGVTGGALAYSADGLTEDIPFAIAHTNVVNKAQIYVSDGLLVVPSYLS